MLDVFCCDRKEKKKIIKKKEKKLERIWTTMKKKKKKSFRTWFFQMFFNKSLIKCEKFASCLKQYSKKYWKCPETYALILPSYWTPQFQNFAIPPIWLSSHSVTQRYFYQSFTEIFTNLLIGIFGVSNPTYFFFEIVRNMCQL